METQQEPSPAALPINNPCERACARSRAVWRIAAREWLALVAADEQTASEDAEPPG